MLAGDVIAWKAKDTVTALEMNRGDTAVRVAPARSREIGAFGLSAGAEAFVDILAEGSKGPVIADAVHFRRVAK